jgi:hypothetical protein
MHHFSMRLTWPDDPNHHNDFVFMVDSMDARRCSSPEQRDTATSGFSGKHRLLDPETTAADRAR